MENNITFDDVIKHFQHDKIINIQTGQVGGFKIIILLLALISLANALYNSVNASVCSNKGIFNLASSIENIQSAQKFIESPNQNKTELLEFLNLNPINITQQQEENKNLQIVSIGKNLIPTSLEFKSQMFSLLASNNPNMDPYHITLKEGSDLQEFILSDSYKNSQIISKSMVKLVNFDFEKFSREGFPFIKKMFTQNSGEIQIIRDSLDMLTPKSVKEGSEIYRQDTSQIIQVSNSQSLALINQTLELSSKDIKIMKQFFSPTTTSKSIVISESDYPAYLKIFVLLDNIKYRSVINYDFIKYLVISCNYNQCILTEVSKTIFPQIVNKNIQNQTLVTPIPQITNEEIADIFHKKNMLYSEIVSNLLKESTKERNLFIVSNTVPDSRFVLDNSRLLPPPPNKQMLPYQQNYQMFPYQQNYQILPPPPNKQMFPYQQNYQMLPPPNYQMTTPPNYQMTAQQNNQILPYQQNNQILPTPSILLSLARVQDLNIENNYMTWKNTCQAMSNTFKFLGNVSKENKLVQVSSFIFNEKISNQTRIQQINLEEHNKKLDNITAELRSNSTNIKEMKQLDNNFIKNVTDFTKLTDDLQFVEYNNNKELIKDAVNKTLDGLEVLIQIQTNVNQSLDFKNVLNETDNLIKFTKQNLNNITSNSNFIDSINERIYNFMKNFGNFTFFSLGVYFLYLFLSDIAAAATTAAATTNATSTTTAATAIATTAAATTAATATAIATTTAATAIATAAATTATTASAIAGTAAAYLLYKRNNLNEHPDQNGVLKLLNKKYNNYIQSLPQINLSSKEKIRIKKIITRLVELEINLFKPSGSEYTFTTAYNKFLES